MSAKNLPQSFRRWLAGVFRFVGAAEHRSDRWMKRSLFERLTL
ncbi:hypothetical protein [Thiogranum longum]|nr:hypothetical protein [Thiogranum longum]